jgi:hypothetical protein
LGRPPLPLGTSGKVLFATLPNGRIRARVKFRDYDGRVRLVSKVTSTVRPVIGPRWMRVIVLPLRRIRRPGRHGRRRVVLAAPGPGSSLGRPGAHRAGTGGAGGAPVGTPEGEGGMGPVGTQLGSVPPWSRRNGGYRSVISAV